MPATPPNGPVTLPAAGYDYTILNTSLTNALATADIVRDGYVADALASAARGIIWTLPTAYIPSYDFSDARNSFML